MAQQVAYKVAVCIVKRCTRCGGSGRIVNDADTSTFRECPVCRGTGGDNEEIPLDDLVAMVADSLSLEARLVQKVGS